MKHNLLTTFCAALAVTVTAIGCSPRTAAQPEFIGPAIRNARTQIGLQIDSIEASGRVLNPVTIDRAGKVYYCGYADWRSGFFPGTVWQLYRLTGDETLLPAARKYTGAITEARHLTWHHDIGFIVNCSYGNALEIAPAEDDREAMITAAKSLCTRFREAPGVIQSWNVGNGSWQAQRGWECPVIIDNMMNLELFFKATELSGDSTFYHTAVRHANRTLQEHFRADGSCYHVVDYSLADGSVRHRETAQGYAHESAWSRGQAWAIYGYTMCYRFTADRRYLDQALRTFRFMRDHPNTPADLIPYWDMDAPKIPDEPRDASSAAIIASALYELSGYAPSQAAEAIAYADRIMESLSSPAYTAAPGANGRFVLMHSVGSIPHGSEIDVPLNYADYYYLEALVRRSALSQRQE